MAQSDIETSFYAIQTGIARLCMDLYDRFPRAPSFGMMEVTIEAGSHDVMPERPWPGLILELAAAKRSIHDAISLAVENLRSHLPDAAYPVKFSFLPNILLGKTTLSRPEIFQASYAGLDVANQFSFHPRNLERYAASLSHAQEMIPDYLSGNEDRKVFHIARAGENEPEIITQVHAKDRDEALLKYVSVHFGGRTIERLSQGEIDAFEDMDVLLKDVLVLDPGKDGAATALRRLLRAESLEISPA